MIVTVHKAKTQLSKLIAAALEGEEVVIARGTKPVVRLAPVHETKPRPGFGAYKGTFELTEAFFEPLSDEEIARWWGGSG